MKALYHTQAYQRRIAKAFYKKVKIRHVQQGDLVLIGLLSMILEESASPVEVDPM